MGSKIPFAKAHDQQVLHRLLAKVMVDAVTLLFLEDTVKVVNERLALARSRPKGFWTESAGSSRRRRGEKADFLEQRGDGGEDIGRCGQVIEMVAVRAAFGVKRAQAQAAAWKAPRSWSPPG